MTNGDCRSDRRHVGTIAILFGESDATHCEHGISATWPGRLSAVVLGEATMVVEGKGGAPAGRPAAPGGGSAGQSSGGFDFGDCLAYALAKATGEPLLFKGDDFARTDVEAA